MFSTTVAVLALSISAPIAIDRQPTPVIEQKLVGEWTKGGACIGDITFRADGTYERKHFSPGNNTLTGRWKVRWDALPPTLVLICEQSDRMDFVGKTWEVKITRLDDEGLNFDSGQQTAGHFTRE